ncbi:MAG: PAS domain S-box protein [Verrucomicrobia bacterium]|nr:PAS domain S-box protein [Verrucomicrobiota bacterium]
MNVLIVEDHATNRKLLRTQLEADNFTVFESPDGVEALGLLEREPVDAIISDVLMPKMDGYRLCAEVRARERLCRIPFIVYTNTFTSRGDKRLAAEVGADRYLKKPAATVEILATLRDLLKRPPEHHPTAIRPEQELSLMKTYNRQLVEKLEEKNAQLLKQTEESRRSEERFRQLAGAVTQVFWVANLDLTQMLYVSPAYEKVWGRSLQSLYERPSSWLEAVHPEDRDRVIVALDTPKRVQGFEGEYRIVRPDGSVRWIHDRGFPIRNEAGEVYRVAGIAEDITARKQVEDSARQLAAIVESSDDAILSRTLEGTILSWNRGAERIYGYRPDEVIGKPISILCCPESTEELEQIFESLRRDERLEHFETIRLRKDGKRIHLSLTVSSLKDTAGNVIGGSTIARDITARKQAEEAVRLADRQRKELIASLDGIVWEADAETFRFTFVSSRAERLLGFPLSRWTEEPAFWADHLHPDDREEAVRYCAQCTREKYDHEFEYRILAADGHAVWLRDMVTVVVENDRPAKLRGIMVDITQRKRAEAALRESEEHYRAVVEDQTEIICRIKPDGSYVFVNDVFCRFFWKTKDEMVGQKWFPEAHPEDVEMIQKKLKTMSPAHPIILVENRVYSGKGDLHWMQFVNRGFFDPQGRLTEIQSVGRDITGRKRVEEALRESEAVFRSLSESSPLGILLLDDLGNCTYANPRARAIFKVGAIAVMGEGWTRYILPADRARTIAGFLAALQDRAEYSTEFSLRLPDSTLRQVSMRTAPIRSEGESSGHVATVEDVTEHRRTEAALHELSGRLLKAQDEEARRIARELHDSTAQKLASLMINLGKLDDELTNESAKIRRVLRDSLALVDGCSQEIRTISYLLHPPLLEELGLTVALRSYADGFSKRSGITVNLDLPRGPQRLPAALELTMFRVVQESLGNIHRHSGSKSASIRLRREPNSVVLEVRDKGHGISSRKPSKREGKPEALGVGIVGMTERLRLAGGHLEIISGKRGTTVRATVPLKQTEQ